MSDKPDDVDDEPDEDDETGEGEPDGDVPEGASVFPLIPEELGVHPLLLATLHAYVFLSGSEEEVLNGKVADEAMQYLARYLQRLNGADLRRTREDIKTLVGYAKHEKWPKPAVHFLTGFLADLGVGD